MLLRDTANFGCLTVSDWVNAKDSIDRPGGLRAPLLAGACCWRGLSGGFSNLGGLPFLSGCESWRHLHEFFELTLIHLFLQQGSETSALVKPVPIVPMELTIVVGIHSGRRHWHGSSRSDPALLDSYRIDLREWPRKEKLRRRGVSRLFLHSIMMPGHTYPHG
ncbi:hypothetical protein AXF42_Ash005222 [Apostasia shenzhenica]|uniref:Uncharacterized protein n=1 Tax=Apostasia shenzhenica TaxID=1088818 RepID=A0A2I0B696_9ASPA|nr:hypothetical protein AXF42_Ash005222 [Apostasia shenzhenica]